MRSCQLCLEYEIARRGRRIDAVIIIDHVVIVLEFKGGLVSLDGSAQWQVREYGLDLRDFHAGSFDVAIVRVLVSAGTQVHPVEPLRFVIAVRLFTPLYPAMPVHS